MSFVSAISTHTESHHDNELKITESDWTSCNMAPFVLQLHSSKVMPSITFGKCCHGIHFNKKFLEYTYEPCFCTRSITVKKKCLSDHIIARKLILHYHTKLIVLYVSLNKQTDETKATEELSGKIQHTP